MRLITRADLDGLACAALLQRHEKIDELLLTHPQEILDGRIQITDNDVIANLPCDPRCAKCFDHRPPERGAEGKVGGTREQAASAAELVWRYYGEDADFAELVEAASRLDSARLEPDDVLDPQGYILFGYTLDARTGLGAFQSYFRSCVDWVGSMPIDQILQQPEVRDRIRRMRESEEAFRRALLNNSVLDGNVVITDFRAYRPPPIGNRFLIYCLFPDANVSLRLHWGHDRRHLVAAVGHSVFKRTCNTDVGALMARFGGGGHRRAGGAPLLLEEAEEKIEEILTELKRNG